MEGTVAPGHGVSTRYLEHVVPLVEKRCQLPNLAPGTLNLTLYEHFPIESPDAMISREEFAAKRVLNKPDQWIKLKKCTINGRGAVIVRPEHHDDPGRGDLYFRLEIMAQYNLRRTLGLNDGDLVSVKLGG